MKKPTKKPTQTASELSRELGVSRQLLSYWTRRPGAPPLSDLKGWRDFLAAHARSPVGSTPQDRAQLRALRAANLFLQNERLQIHNEIARKHWTPLADVQRDAAKLCDQVRKVVSTLHQAAGEIAGKTAVEIEAILKTKEDEIIEQLHVLHSRI